MEALQAALSNDAAAAGYVPACGTPAVATKIPGHIDAVADGEPARRVEQAEAGLTVGPADPHALKETFCRLATDTQLRDRLGSAGRRAAETVYNRDLIADRLDDFLRSLITTPSRST